MENINLTNNNKTKTIKYNTRKDTNTKRSEKEKVKLPPIPNDKLKSMINN